MFLLIRFALIFLFFACIIAIPVFLIKLNEIEKKKKTDKHVAQTVAKKEPTMQERAYASATPNVRERFLVIQAKQKVIQEDNKFLSLESSHYVTETFANDFKNYQTAYLDLKNKKQIESEVIDVLDNMIYELQMFEKEIEEKKKAVLDRQGYIIENREKNHL